MVDSHSNNQELFYKNGGFDQYFSNTDGSYFEETLKFLREIEDRDFSIILEKAITLYLSNSSEDDKCYKFNEIDDKFYKLDRTVYEGLYDKLVRYLKG